MRSAVGQTWSNKEIIVVDDGSRDRTFAVAQRFQASNVKVVTQPNGGAAAARNHAFSLAQGDYIQWLDADDLLGQTKVEDQVNVSERIGDPRLLMSGPWGHFRCRPSRARFRRTPLCGDLSPVEWLFRKMDQNLHMQTATWLSRRELLEATGDWDPAMHVDDDGEYFTRAMLASSGVSFVPTAKVFYRITTSRRVSFIGRNPSKIQAMFRSIQLHVERLLSLEDSPRTRQACVNYINTWRMHFYPERPDLMKQLSAMATDLGGALLPPRFRRNYAWLEPLIGPGKTKQAQLLLRQFRSQIAYSMDRALLRLHL